VRFDEFEPLSLRLEQMSFRVYELSSSRNPLVQEIRRAAADGRSTDAGLLVAEGPHLVEELLRSSWELHTLVVTPETLPAWESRARDADLQTIVLPSKTFSTISSTEATQGVLALVRPSRWDWKDLKSKRALIVALDGLQDPGNAGTIVRSAEAFGATGIVFLPGCVRIANAKLMRAAAGSLFRLPFLEGVERQVLLSNAQSDGLAVYSLSIGHDRPISDVRWTEPCVIVVGSEGAGVSETLSRAAEHISIPMRHVESLNAGVACSIALFEASRQRSLP
jgi:RNA methyltransferase, TrmH family